MNAKIGLVPSIILLILAAAGTANAQETGVEEHDGFLLRLSLGGAYNNASANTPVGDMGISGGGASFSLALGGAVAQNLTIYGEAYDAVTVGPKVKLNSKETNASDDVSFGMVGFGPGINYYIMPANVYVAATVGVAQLSLTTNGQSGETQTGFGTKVSVGKEWWVSDNWGLGLAGQFIYMNIPDDADTTWTALSGGLALSATYQ